MNQRHIPTDGAPNLRDLGGYPTLDGKHTRWKLAYRSDDLYDLSDGDLRTLEGLGIKLVVDFRTRHETLMSPDRVPTGARSVHIPIDAGRLMTHTPGESLNARKTRGIMISVYRDLAHNFRDSFREFFALVADSANIPVLFHCTAGKDRTGFAAAMFLSAAGVDRETILADYLLSLECLRTKYVEGVDYDEALKPLYQVEEEYLQSAFDVVDRQFGGVEAYLAEQLGVDVPAFRGMFVE